MLRIGLTGGIGCGKSTVCEFFAKRGIPVIDTDQLAHTLVKPGTKALQQITQQFGREVIRTDGSLDRAKMRELIFEDEEKRHQLEAPLHPLIRQEMQRQLDALDTPYAILAIPLLLEKGWQNELDRVLVVDCSEAQQLQRAQQRDGSSSDTIRRIIDSQIDRTRRLEAADDIIDNSGKSEAIAPQVEALHQRYLQLASNN